MDGRELPYWDLNHDPSIVRRVLGTLSVFRKQHVFERDESSYRAPTWALCSRLAQPLLSYVFVIYFLLTEAESILPDRRGVRNNYGRHKL